jgi:hypothetical protein
MPKHPGESLRLAIERELPSLRAVTEMEARQNDGRPESWTRKQELGHLIDSAANNHMQVALAAIEGEFRGPGYAQDRWVEAHGYHEMEWQSLVDIWYGANVLLAQLASRVPEKDMENRCVIGGRTLTLRFVVEDYIVHLQHHLDHLLGRKIVTQYPPPAYVHGA